jgi:hypothetical protein
VHRALILGLLVACHGKADSHASCGTVAGNFLTLAKAELARVQSDEATQRADNDQLPAMRDSLAAACTDGAWSGEVRDCLAGATDHTAFEACEHALTTEQRTALGSGK